MFQFNKKTKNKKGVSTMVAYVMLISITIALAAILYPWLKSQVIPGEELKCDDGISLIIREYNYNCTTNTLNLTLQNKGLFTADGFIVRVSNQDNAEFGIYILNKSFEEIKVAETKNYQWQIDTAEIISKLTFVEVQALQIIDQKEVLCSSVDEQVLSC